MNDFTLKQMLEFYKEKYFDGSEFMVIKSLSYFEEATTTKNVFRF